jgi:hypothetical protein
MYNREDLQNRVEMAISDIHKLNMAKQIRERMLFQLKEYFDSNKTLQILNKMIPIQTLSENELINLCTFLRRNGILNINPNEYWTELEQTTASNDKVKMNQYSNIQTLNLQNVLKIDGFNNTQYVTQLSYEQLANLLNVGVISYNFATQRRARIIKVRNRVERVASINMDNVVAIKNEILNGTFQTNTITLNIRATGKEMFSYNSENMALSIPITEDNSIDCIDGYHRLKAIQLAYSENNNVEGSMIVSIKNLTIEQARYFILQESKGTLNNQHELELYDMSGNIAKLIHEINSYNNKNNILYNSITSENNNENTLIFYDVFAEILQVSFGDLLNEADTIELYKLKQFIVDVYSIAYSLICKRFNVNTVRELTGLPIDQMVISGFLFVAHEMYVSNNNEVDVQKLEKIVRKIDFDDDRLTYTNFNDKYDVNRYTKMWIKLAKVKVK